VRLTLIRRRKQSAEPQNQHSPFFPQSFVLCERSSGAVRFRVESGPDGSMPVEKIAGLLAVHCLVRGQAPEDYELMVVPKVSLLDAAAERAQELLAAGRALGAGVKVSRREQEVLDCILQSLANKEIAAKLNVAERTVKFHVSSLLAKFGVTDRVALSREASLGRMPALTSSGQISPETLFGFPVRGQQGAPEESPAASAPEKTPAPPREAQRTRNRLMPMFTRERFAT
jgi:DNA-binding CsgD family transcriptional regulator